MFHITNWKRGGGGGGGGIEKLKKEEDKYQNFISVFSDK